MALTQNTYTGDGSTVLFSFTFPYQATTDIKVSVDGTTTTAFTLANATTVQFNTAPANATVVRIFRETNVDSLAAEFFSGSAIRADDLNNDFNQILFSTQETRTRSLNASGGTMTGALNMGSNKITNLATPTASTDSSTKGYVDSLITTHQAQVTAAQTAATNSSNSASASATSATNSANSATASQSSATSAAGSASSAATQAGNSATSASAAAASASTAAASQAAAASNQTSAASSQTAAAASQASAAASATAAAASATSATGQASAAANSATSAASSAASALAAFDNFDDTYLGPKSSDPTADNDGDALNGGDLYYNTVSNVMKVYTGSSWVIAYVPGDAANISSSAFGNIVATNVQSALQELDTDKVQKTGPSQSAVLPVGTTSQRDASPSPGRIRYNSTLNQFEGYSTTWGSIGGGATGGSADQWALEHDNTITASYTIGTGKNVISAGPLTVNSGATVTVPSGSNWVIV